MDPVVARSKRRPAGVAAGEAPLVTNHMRLLVAVAERPHQSSQIAARVGLDGRHIRRLLDDLEASGYLSRRREGSCNRYTVHVDERVRQPDVAGTVGGLLAAVRGER